MSHSGQNVIQLPSQSDQAAMLSLSPGCAPSVELRGAEHDDPVVTRGVVASELCENVAAQRTSSEYCEDLEGDDGGVGEAPASICARVFLPWRVGSAGSTAISGRRTELGEGTLAGVHLPPEGRQPEE